MGQRLDSINRVLTRFGAELQRHDPLPAESPANSRMRSEDLHRELLDELVDIASPVLERASLPSGRDWLREVVEDLWSATAKLPVKDASRGGSWFHNLFWLYVFGRAVDPEFVVESGVFKGQSLAMLRQAAPSAEMHAFDLSFANLLERLPGVTYHESDWSEVPLSASGRRSLAYFDCHVDHGRRIREAHERGFRTLLFDDAPPTHKLYAYGAPGTPTVPMLFDSRLSDGQTIVWTWRGLDRSYRHDAEAARTAADLVDSWETLPDVGGVTRLRGFSFLTLVRLKA